MKIRIKGNTLRYRLTKSEVSRLGAEGKLEECIEFAGKTLFYAIEQASKDATGLAADFIGNKIVLYIPKVMINEFVNTERVGFEGRNGLVNLLIEKDFVCIDRVEEDQSDNYPNPNISC